MTRGLRVLLSLAVVGVAAWFLWPAPDRRGGAALPGDAPSGVTRRSREAEPASTGASALLRGESPERRPAGERRSALAIRTTEAGSSERAGDGGAVSGPSTRGRAVIRGRALIPPDLLIDREHMGLHVARTTALDLGTASEIWIVPGAIRDDGTYELKELPPGRYLVQIVLRGRAISESLRMPLKSGEFAGDKDFRFERQAVLAGRVFALLDAAPLSGAEVRIGNAPPEITDEKGEFTLYDLPAGRHELLVVHPDHAPQHASVRIVGDSVLRRKNVYLSAGAEARIEAVSPLGEPLARVHITLSNADHLVAAVTDEHGQARFRGLQPGATYRVMLPGRRLDTRETLLVPELESVREVSLELPE